MGEVTILKSDGAIAASVGYLDLELPLNSIIHQISVFPVSVSIPTTTVGALLYEGDNFITQVMPRDTASSNASYPQAAVSTPHLPLPRDRTYKLRTVIYNITAGTLWRVVVIVEVVE